MKTINPVLRTSSVALIAAAVASLLLSACASAPVKPAGAADARARLTALQDNAALAARAPEALRQAEVAVSAAEQPELDHQVAQYRVYMAERKIDIATAQARTALAVDERQGLARQRDKDQLDARTREADLAASKLASARVVIADQKAAVDVAILSAQDSAQQSADLQQQLDALHAKSTDRGMVLTLGDVLFATGRAELKSGATNNLDRLVSFLNNYPNRTIIIEGYTDSVGGDDYNLGLSQRRADSVKAYLTGQGIGSARVTTSGKGDSDPVAGNDSASGRQQNRRVEVIIDNPPPVVSR
jgi:outer membrane protein OmpA-like peptidoglycan-associated protein